MTANAQSPLKFPCDFPLKIMGHASADFDVLVVEIVSRHVGEIAAEAIQRRPSSQGKYLAITITIQAESQDQLDALYRELSGHSRVLMVL